MKYALILCMALAGCGNPPIKLDGTNCLWYGVDEDQRAALDCDLDDNGWPVVEIVTLNQLKGLCGNSAGLFDKRFVWGCIEYREGIPYPVADKNIQTVRHETCHCLLGPGHTIRPIELSASSPYWR